MLRLIALILLVMVVYDGVKFLLSRAIAWPYIQHVDWGHYLSWWLAPLAYIGFAGNVVMRRVWQRYQ